MVKMAFGIIPEDFCESTKGNRSVLEVRKDHQSDAEITGRTNVSKDVFTAVAAAAARLLS
jgi:hypothetical protein